MPRPIVPAPSTAIVSIERADAASSLFPSEFVLNVSLEKRGRTWKGGFNSGHGLAGACLVRLTRTPIVILYAQPKTPTYFHDKRVRSRSGSDGILSLNLI